MIDMLIFMWAGLCILGIAVGSYTGVAEYAFMIIGGGILLIGVIGMVVHYLDPSR